MILYQNDPYVELGANASDACDLNVSIEIGGDAVDTSVIDIYAVTYNAADASGNVASTKVRTVTVLPRFAALDALFGCIEVKLGNQATVNGSLASNYQVDLHDASQVTGDVISVAGQAQLKKNASVAGHVDAGRKVTLHNNAVVGLSVISGEKIDLKKNAQIGGDATSAGEVKLAAGAVVNGLISEDQIVEALDDIPLPILSIATSGSNITVKKNKSAAIAPGSYQRLNAKENSLVELVGGHYTFSEIKVGKRSEILLDVSTGPITIDVSGNALFEGVDMLIWGGDASDVLFQIQGDEAKLGSHAQKKNTNHMGTYTGTFLVPNGQVMLESKATLTGSTYAQSVLLKNESVLNSAPALDLLIGASVNWLGMEACLPQVEKSASKSASQSKSKSISIREKSTSESTSKKKEKSKSKKKR